MQHLLEGRNPLIAQSELSGQYMTPEDTMDMNKFQFAFYIEDYFSGELKDDPSLVTLFGVIFYMTHDNTLQN